MKATVLLITFILGGFFLYAQDGDTTKIKIGDTKIIIIDKNDDAKTQKDKAELAKKEFEKLLEEKQKALEEQELMLEKLRQENENQKKDFENQQDETLKQAQEQKMAEMEEKMSEIEKKSNELQKEINALEKGLSDLESNVNDDFDEDDEDWAEDKSDWKFDKDWPRDWDNMSPFGRKKKFRGHWAGFELGLNNYMSPDNQFLLSEADRGFELNAGSSWVFALNFLEFNIPFGRHAGLVTGIGTSWNNYNFRDNVNVYKDENGIMVASPETTKSYNRNSLHSWNFNFPLILEFQVPSGKGSSGIYLGIGVVGTAKVSSWGNIEYILDGVKYEERRKSDFLQNSLRYGLTARLGLKYLRLFANYDLVPLFQTDRGPELYPVSVGITLLSF